MANRYPIITGGASNTTATWATSSGQAVGGASIPVSGDAVICDATMVGNLVWTGSQSFDSLDCTGCVGTMSGSGTLSILGDTFKLDAGMTYTATGTVTFTGANAAGDVTLTRAGKTSSQFYTFNGVGKVFKLADAHNIGTGNITVTNGTLNSQGFDITCGSVTSNNTNIRVINMAGSDLFLSGVLLIPGAGLTLTAPDRIIFTRSASTTAATALITANAGDALNLVEIDRAVTGIQFSGFQIIGAIEIAELSLVGAAGTGFLCCIITIANDITLDKMSLPKGSGILSTVNGTQRTITTNTNEISFDVCMIRDIVISGGPAVAQGCIDLGNNSGISFQNFGPNTHEITGVTYDNDGAILGSCICTATKEVGGIPVVVGTTVSDAVTGAYTIGTPDNDAAAYTVTWTKLGSPRGDAMCGITPTAP